MSWDLVTRVTLGDGSALDVTGGETVNMDMLLNDGIRWKYTLKKVLYIPELAYDLISVARAGYAEKTVHFGDSSCEFRNKDEIITVGAPEVCQEISGGCERGSEREQRRYWHCRFGHLNEQSMKRLVKKDLVSKLYYDKTHYVWVFPLKAKDQVFEHLKEWQAEVKTS